jgi:hypothetical protein
VNLETPPRPDLPAEATTSLNANKAGEVLWESAWSALVLAFLAQIFGSIVVGIVGGMWHDMTPSLPPGLAHKPQAEAEPSAWNFSWLQEHRFALLFAAFFLVEAGTRLARYSGNARQRRAAALIQRLRRRASAEWINVIVVNAFGAFVTVLVIQVTQQFTWSALLWSFIWDAIRSVARTVASVLPGGGLFRGVGALFSWYQENQFKFMFWFLYAAAICDDLGLPNFKSLGRYLWRRWRRRHLPPAEKPAES